MAYQYPYGNYTSGNSIIWVQGENGAKAYPVAPGGTVLLMDSEEKRFFIKSADASGFPLPLRVFRFEEETDPKQAETDDFVKKDEFEKFRAEIKALISKKEAKKEEKDEQSV